MAVARQRTFGVRGIHPYHDHELLVFYEGVNRLVNHVAFTPSTIAVGVMAISMVVDSWRSKAFYSAVRKYHSQALEAVQGFDKIEEIKSFIAASSSLLLRNVAVEATRDVRYVDISCVAQGSA